MDALTDLLAEFAGGAAGYRATSHLQSIQDCLHAQKTLMRRLNSRRTEVNRATPLGGAGVNAALLFREASAALATSLAAPSSLRTEVSSCCSSSAAAVRSFSPWATFASSSRSVAISILRASVLVF